jgi:hypothetical protein
VPSFDHHPHIEVAIEDMNLQRSLKKSEVPQVKFWVWASNSHHPEKIENSKSPPEKIFYEDLEKDKLRLEILVAGKMFGRVKIPLKETTATPVTSWNLLNDDDVEVGVVNISVKFVNQGQPTLKDNLNKAIQVSMLQNFFPLSLMTKPIKL